MVMPNTYPALALAPQTASYIASDSPLRAYYMGREERLDDERRNYLREAGGMASQGNISGAVGAAFRGGDPTTAMNIANWDTGRRVQAITMLREGAQRADTPERWAAMVSSVERVFGPEMVGNYRDFNSRPGAMTALEQAELQLRQAQTASQQAQLPLIQAQTAAQQQHGALYEAQAAAAGRQADNQRAFLNLLQPPSPSAATAAPPPLPPSAAAGAPVAAPPGAPGISPPPQAMQRGGIGSDAVAAPPMAAPSPVAPGGALTPGAAPSPQPQAGPVAPAAPPAPQAAAPEPPAQPQSRRTVADIFGSSSPTEQAEVLALISQNKIDDAMKKLREIESGGTPLTARQRAESEEGLRREFATLAKPYFDVRDAYTRIEQVAQNPSAAGDLALIFNFMKMLDPGSTVREGEFATAASAAGVPERVWGLYNRVASGQRLTPDQRNDFVAQSGRLMSTQESQYQAIQSQYLDIATRGGLDPRNVFVDFSRPAPSRAQATQLLSEARDAIASGRDPQAVMSRLHQLGIDPSQMGMVPYSRQDMATPGFYGNY